MVRRVLMTAAAVSLALGFAVPALAQQSRPRIAVMNFENNSTWTYWGDNLGRAAADELVTQLLNGGQFTVIERTQLESVIAEQKLGASGAVDASTAARIGKILGVQFILTGSITQFSIERTRVGFGGFGANVSNAQSKVDVRLISTETAEILIGLEGEGNKRMGGASFRGSGAERDFDQGAAQEALRPAIEQVIDRLNDRVGQLASAAPAAPTGQVVGVNGAMVYINRGEGAGVTVGQRFTVNRVVDEIRDADGRVLDRVVGKVGVVEVTQVLSQSSICKVVEGDVQENDTIE